jgi:type I restriction-modification system DNA methylase subunit
MSATTRNQVFSAVHTVGALLPADMLLRVSEGKDVPGSKPADYGLPTSESVRDEAERAWEYLKPLWRRLRTALPADATTGAASADPTGLAGGDWLSPLFRALDFGPLTAVGEAGVPADSDETKTFPVSHRWSHVLIHQVPWNAELDKRPAPGAVPPQSMLQECLNRTEAHLWGLLTNGRQIRLLRDSSALATASYVEFDLEAVFDGELFSEFVLLYRLLHVSRFQVAEGAAPSGCWLEKWRTEAIASGARALDQLRKGVQQAITTLGTGFLRHPENAPLRENVDPAALHGALLRLVYRLLFVFVAEDRDALLDPDASDAAKERYAKYFSSARLRSHARRRRGTAHGDLYQALRIVLDALGDVNGRPELGLPGLGGIFDKTEVDAPLRGLSLSNEYLLTAVRHLSQVRDASTRRWRTIDYRHLGAEELGSVYESLLELVPQHSASDRTFELVELAGNTRKTTGSYYTPSSLIECLLDSTLDPVIDDAVKRGEIRATAKGEPDPTDEIVDELLSLTVCDPACGSGHFLVAAARRIAKRVAAVRDRNPEPTVAAVRHALHEVVARCIYGVDLNPMAVDLAKVSLWLEALEPGKPLSFLDAHIKQGNALIGATPALLRKGIPDEAFKPIEGDDKKYAKVLERQNKAERSGQQGLFDLDSETRVSNTAFAAGVRRITTAASDNLAEVRRQASAYRDFAESEEFRLALHVADAWCAAFVWPKTLEAPRAITQNLFLNLQNPVRDAAPQRTHDEITRLRDQYGFFHWHLEFPEVFTVPGTEPVRDVDEATGWAGGFACVLGNPPWDTLSPDEKEFFSTYEPAVRAMKKDARQATVAKLLELPELQEKWTRHRRNLYASTHFLKDSGRYRLFAKGNLGKGDFNAYRMFVESAFTLSSPNGAVAQVTPSGIYNGANAQAIRAELFDHWNLHLMLGFINTGEQWFDGADATMRFGAYAARRPGPTINFSVGFQIKNTIDLINAIEKPFQMSVEVVRSQSPEALAISETIGGIDSEITDHLYEQWPAFGVATADFPRRTYQREIDMGTDRDRYTDEEQGLPLYEGRMVGQYDYRAKAYLSGRGRSAVWQELEFGASGKEIKPQWVVPTANVPGKIIERINRYRIGFCDVTSPRNERSLVATLIPPGVVCGHKVPTILFPDDSEWAYPLWLAAANSLCMDFLARKKVTLTMALNVLDSLPFPRLKPGNAILDRIATLVLRLVCTGPEMTGYWNSMAQYGWAAKIPANRTPAEALIDSQLRAEAMAEIDAIVAKKLFNLNRSQMEHVLKTFPTLQRKDMRKYGTYRTKNLVLSAYDCLP